MPGLVSISQVLVNASRKPQNVRILAIQVFTLQRQSRHQSLNGAMYRSLDHVRERWIDTVIYRGIDNGITQ